MISASASRRRAWREVLVDPVVVVGIGLVVLQLVFRGWALYTNWFFSDDYKILLAAQDSDLDRQYLLEPMNSHLMPGTRLIAWFVEGSGILNWPLAATYSLILVAASSFAALWMLCTVFGRRWGAIALLCLYLSSAMTAQATMWWISSLNQTPVQLAFFVAVASAVRYFRGSSAWWLVVTAAGILFGLLFFQKALLVIPVLAYLALAYFSAGSVLRRFLTVIRRYWVGIVVVAAVAAAYLGYFLTQVEQPLDTSAPSGGIVQLAGNMIGIAFIVAVFGGPWDWVSKDGGAWADPAMWATVLCWVLAVLVVAYGALTRHRTMRAWSLLALYLGGSVLLVAQSRGMVYGSEIGLAYRLQTEVICVFVLCAGLAFMPLPGAVESSSRRAEPLLTLSLPRAVVPVAIVLITASGCWNWATYAVDWRDENKSDPYVHRLSSDLDLLGTADLVDQEVPPKVLPGLFYPENRVSWLTPLLAGEAHFPFATPRLAVVDVDGSVHGARIKLGLTAKQGPVEGCGWRVDDRGRNIPLAGQAIPLTWWIRIGYLASGDSPVVVSVPGDRMETRISEGINTLFVRLEGTFDKVRIDGLAPNATMCVDTMALGLPVPE